MPRNSGNTDFSAGGVILVDALILAGVIAGVIGGALGAALRFATSRPAEKTLVLLGVAGGSAEAHLWTQRLREAGIQFHMRSIGDMAAGDLTTPGGSGLNAYWYEVWVRPKDQARAREVLGL